MPRPDGSHDMESHTTWWLAKGSHQLVRYTDNVNTVLLETSKQKIEEKFQVLLDYCDQYSMEIS